MDSAETNQDKKYSKRDIMKSETYRDRRDLAEALLKEDETYTLKEADTMIYRYQKGKVR